MQALELQLKDLPLRMQQMVQDELRSGESLQWIGRPIPKRLAMKMMPMILFAIPWTAFALFWTAGAAGFKFPLFNQPFDLFPLFGLPFILIGLGMFCSPLWMVWKAKRTAYVLTNKRAILFDGGRSTTIRSFYLDKLDKLRRIQHADGSGDLIFDREVKVDNDGDNQTTDHGFLAISNVKKVEDHVRTIADFGVLGAD